VVLDADVVVSDAELDALNSGSGNYDGASLTLVRNGGVSSDDVFSFIDGNGITLSGSSLSNASGVIATFDITTTAGQLVITFSDTAEIPTSADVDKVLQQIAYANSSDTLPTSVQIDWTFDDGNTGAQGPGGALQATGSTTVTIIALNEAPTFTTAASGDGIVTTDSGNGGDQARAVTVQSDGKILVAGDEANEFGLYRYNTDGSLDPSFGGGDGMVATDVSADADWGQAVVVQGDGKILVAGYSNHASNKDIFVLRYDSDGTLDATFGTGGIVTLDFAGQNDAAKAIALQADGKILVAGSVSGASEWLLARYDTDGSLDTSFDGDGMVTLDVSGTDWGTDVVVQPDGKILIGGRAMVSGDYTFAVARYDSGGSLDATFGGGDGIAQVDVATGSDFGEGIALQTDGKILQTGYNTTSGELIVVRWDSAGVLDTSFDSDGIVTTDIAGGDDFGEAIAVQADGKLLVAGYHNNGTDDDFAAVRYNSDGSLDTSFGGGDGIVTTPIGSGTDQGLALAILPDGSSVLVGKSHNGTDDDVALVRYTSDGALDTDLDGTTTLDGAPAFGQGGPAVVLDADVAVRDAELDALNSGSGNYDGASVTLVRNGGANAEDDFSFVDGNGITLSGTDLSNGSGVIATFDITTTAGQLVITFSDTAAIPTSADVDKVLQQIAYSNSSGTPPASVQIDWRRRSAARLPPPGPKAISSTGA